LVKTWRLRFAKANAATKDKGKNPFKCVSLLRKRYSVLIKLQLCTIARLYESSRIHLTNMVTLKGDRNEFKFDLFLAK
jgi:hypothetical protein